MSSSVFVSDPESDDMFMISIFDILSLLEKKLLNCASGPKSEEIPKVSIVGDRY